MVYDLPFASEKTYGRTHTTGGTQSPSWSPKAQRPPEETEPLPPCALKLPCPHASEIRLVAPAGGRNCRPILLPPTPASRLRGRPWFWSWRGDKLWPSSCCLGTTRAHNPPFRTQPPHRQGREQVPAKGSEGGVMEEQEITRRKGSPHHRLFLFS